MQLREECGALPFRAPLERLFLLPRANFLDCRGKKIAFFSGEGPVEGKFHEKSTKSRETRRRKIYFSFAIPIDQHFLARGLRSPEPAEKILKSFSEVNDIFGGGEERGSRGGGSAEGGERI